MTPRKRVRVVVPRLIGVEIIPAYKMALVAGVAIRGQEPGLPLPLDGVIIAQEPVAGTCVWPGDPVIISLQPSASGSAASAGRRYGEGREFRHELVGDI